MRLILFVITCLLASVATAGEPFLLDGDTFTLDGERIRIVGIDAPELGQAKCAAEKVLAFKASARLGELLAGCAVVLDRQGKDRYGRTLATVTACGRDIGEALIREGLARPWRGRRETWC